MNWTNFPKNELSSVLDSRRAVGLEPIVPLEFGAESLVTVRASQAYMFSWFIQGDS